MWGCCQLRWSPWVGLQAFKGPFHPSSCHKRYHLAFTAECRCSKHEGTIWSSANRWQAAQWCHTHSLVCWKIHGLGCHSGPHLCCIIAYLSQTAISSGSAAEQAAVRKTAKYPLLPATHVFVSIAFETLGPVNAEGAEFLSELGRRISSVSGYQRERNFLLQRLSICVQRHNAIAFRGTFQDGREAWDEA